MVANSFVGTPLGGILAGIALSLPFFIDAGSFAIAAGLVFAIGGSFRAVGAEARAGMRAELAEGLRWLWRHVLLRNLAVFLGLANALSTMAFATYVLFAQESLGLDAGGFGIVLTGLAVGGVAGSLAASRVSRLARAGCLALPGARRECAGVRGRRRHRPALGGVADDGCRRPSSPWCGT